MAQIYYKLRYDCFRPNQKEEMSQHLAIKV